MQTQTYQEISLSEIRVNPHNPRKNFDGPKFDQLVESIKEKGVIEPIVVRPFGREFEIVAGERRFRASCKIDADGSIPAVVKELSEDEAFEFMIVENLQREDLTEMEEAQSFKEFVDKKGEAAIPELADRTGIRAGYIRRRIAVLALPDFVLEEWVEGVLKYGHLEQLLRIKDEKKLQEIVEEIASDWSDFKTVKDLKEWIDSEYPNLKKALFDLKEAGCLKCRENSDVQNKLFDLGSEKGVCHNAKCFKQNQNNHLLKFWKRKYKKKYKTNGFRFQEDVGWTDYETFYDFRSHFDKCLECEKFLTILDVDGDVRHERVCFGGSKCLNNLRYREDKKDSGQKVEKDDEAPRVEWHGEYFREEFFKVRIPERCEEWHSEGKHSAHLMLIALLKSNYDLLKWFVKKMKISKEEGYVHDDVLFKFVFPLTMEATIEIIRQASIEVVMQRDFGAGARWLIADYLGIDLAREYAVTQEYLEKKTIKEMLRFGKKSGLFETKECRDYLEKLGKADFSKCKKTELIDVFLKSGADLVGKVPDEIVERKK